MSKSRKAYTYGGNSKKKGDKDDWKEISKTKSMVSDKMNLPKSKGIWSNVSVSPFKKSPMKLTVNTKIDDPFDFDDDDNDCFSFEENGIKISPKKGKRTPTKQLNSPKSPTGVNPRLFGKNLPDTYKTINVSDLTPNKITKKQTGKGKQLKKGTLAALKAELNSPKKSPSNSPKKGTLAELKEKLTSPKKNAKDKSPVKSPKKGSLAALKEKLSSPKKTTKQKPTEKSPPKKKSPKVVSKKVKKGPSTSFSPKNENSKADIDSGRKRKVGSPNKDAPPVKRSVGRPHKNEETSKNIKKSNSSYVNCSSHQKLHSSSLRLAGRMTRSVASISPPKRTTSRSRRNDGNLLITEILPKKRKVTRSKADEKKDTGEPPSKQGCVETNEEFEEECQDIDLEIRNEEMKDDFQENEKIIVEEEHSSRKIVKKDDKENENEAGMGDNETAEDGTKDSHEEAENRNGLVAEEDEADDDSDEGEEETTHKTKSVFSYYDKQKKSSNENIFGDSKKNVIIFDDGGDAEAVTSQDNENSKQTTDGETKGELCKQDDGRHSPTPNQNETTKQEREKKLVKSPFKSLKPNYRKYRRFSALPTDITMIGNNTTRGEGDEGSDEEEDGKSSFHVSNIFGQSASSSLKVRRDEKELYTVVRDTKHAYQCLEHGESQMFKDDLDYLIDGMKSTHQSITRCLCALELASKCMSPEFRMHMKAHGMIDSIFNVLQDAHMDELLCLCTSVIMYVVSKDRQKTGFSKKIIAFVLNLLTNAPTKESSQKSSEKINTKVKSLFEKYNDSAIDSGNISSAMLARETLLSLTSQKTGEWFKDDIRTLGGLDHVADSIYASSRSIQKKEELEKNFRQTERCLLLLCDVTFKCSKNQEYLVTYREGALIEALVRILTCITTKVDLANDLTPSIQNCLFTMLRFLTNLSHENELGSVKICTQEDALQCFMRCVLYMPQFLPDNKTFDFIVVALGLLINLTEHSKQNIAILNTAFGPACYESEASSSIDDEVSPVEALTHLFMVRNEASKEGDLMEELERLEKEQDEKEAAMHYHDGEDALVCGDRFDDTVEESTASEEKTEEESDNKRNGIELNQKEKQDIRNTLEKAHQHMEDSHVAAYSALLIGLLAEGNKDNQDAIHTLLPDGDFKSMKESLEKILSFMKMTGATNEAGFKVIQRIIDFFKECTKNYEKQHDIR